MYYGQQISKDANFERSKLVFEKHTVNAPHPPPYKIDKGCIYIINYPLSSLVAPTLPSFVSIKHFIHKY